MGVRFAIAVTMALAAAFGGCGRMSEPSASAEPMAASAAPADSGAARGGTAPVVLELFTSQGCSSCPPADAVLSKLGRDPRFAGRVIPIAFHVDYWNYIGWSDPFSSADWTARQNEYARSLRLDSIYTPQLVVNGATHLNGSDESGVLSRIDEASRGPTGVVKVTTRQDGNRLVVDVSAEVPARLDAGELHAVVVLFENGATTSVRRGENSGRTLVNDYIARKIESAFTLAPDAGSHGAKTVTFDLDPSWNRANLGVAAFLQDPATMKIYGAAKQ
jgi:hypothetical protein